MTAIRYPLAVINEFDTLAAVCHGRSIARFGDGEFKLCFGAACCSQQADRLLARRLRDILRTSGDCLVGIPRIDSPSPKRNYWSQFTKVAPFLADRVYYSAFITRPDSAPWINTALYWDTMETLWRDRDVTLVRGSTKSLTADLLRARYSRIREIVAPRQHAFADYARLLDSIGTPERALLCLGPTATVLAVDLCARGVHAIDLGHVGMFLRKHWRGDTMTVTDADRMAV